MIRLNSKKVMALIALALLLATAVFIGISKMTELQEGTGSETVSVVRELETPPEFSETVNVRRYVYVTGAVAHEGVYEVSETTRVFEVLELAGGALPEADLSGVNQADRVYDGMHLRVPFLGDGESDNASAFQGTERININSAGLTELMALKGIGKTKAESILEYRKKNGYFRSVEDLLLVPGIGESILNGIRDFIKV